MSARELESTGVLLQRMRQGDVDAREELLGRYLPILKRWAHGRLPVGARDLADTDDLVQVTLIRVLKQMGSFEPRHEGAFLAYLRRALLNTMRNEIRRSVRRGDHGGLEDELLDPGPTALELTVNRETIERYEAALASLGEEQQEAVILRIEMGFTYEQIAGALAKNLRTPPAWW